MIKEDILNSFSSNYLNKIIDCYSLNLRNLKIKVFGNTGLLRDQFECIDISDNLVSRLSNISNLKKLSVFIACNNEIEYIEENFCINIPNLESLVLSNNNISNINSISALKLLKRLKRLSLIDNPITKISNYKNIIIGMLPNLCFLDFQKISKEDKVNSKLFFESNNITKELALKYLPNENSEFLRNKVDEFDEPKFRQFEKESIIETNENLLKNIKLAISHCKSLDKLKILQDSLEKNKLTLEAKQIINEYINNKILD